MKENYIKSLELKNFTAFDEINFEFSPGINVFIGANATGKTHILKGMYCLVDSSVEIDQRNNEYVRGDDNPPLFIVRHRFNDNFLPDKGNLGRLISRKTDETNGVIKIIINNNEIALNIMPENGATTLVYPYSTVFTISPIYIPPKDILTNAHGFIPEYEKRFLEFEEIYKDILVHAYTPALKFKGDEPFYELLTILEEQIGGKVIVKGDRFYLEDERGLLEFTLLAEGFSKLGLLWLLINNGSIEPGCTLFWDEPETNLNPELLRDVVNILLELQRDDVQIFVATHNYVLLKEFDLQMEETDEVMFHSLYRDEETGIIKRKSTEDYMSIHPDVINETYLDLYVRDMNRTSERDRNDND